MIRGVIASILAFFGYGPGRSVREVPKHVRDAITAEHSRQQIAQIRRNTRPKALHKKVMQPFVQPRTANSRRQRAYHKRKQTLHKR